MNIRDADQAPRRLLDTGQLAPLLREYIKQTSLVRGEHLTRRPGLWFKFARNTVAAVVIVWGIRWLPDHASSQPDLCRETGTGGHSCVNGAKGVEGASGSMRGVGGASGASGA